MADVSQKVGMEVLYGFRRVIIPAGRPGVIRPIPIELFSFQGGFLLRFYYTAVESSVNASRENYFS